jgi:hypothetical protein
MDTGFNHTIMISDIALRPLATYFRIHDTRTMTPDELREQIELEIVEMLKLKMDSGELTETRAKQMAQHALTTLTPGMSFEQMYRAIPELDNTMPEFAPIVLPHVRDYEMNVTSQALETVRNLIKQGQYDAAATLGKKASNRDVELMWTGSGKSSK